MCKHVCGVLATSLLLCPTSSTRFIINEEALSFIDREQGKAFSSAGTRRLARNMVNLSLVAQPASLDTLEPNSSIHTQTFKASIDMSFAQAASHFGLSLFANACQEEPTKDVLLCPLSLSLCLSMAAAGATEGSASEKAFQEMLGNAICETSAVHGNASCASSVPLGNSLDVASSVWIKDKESIKESYIAIVDTKFGADVFPLEGVDPTPINTWVGEKTQGRITSLFDDSLDPLTVMVLVSTVFFKGVWKDKFDVFRTIDSFFKPFEGDPISCKLMFKDKRMMFAESEEVLAARLPYEEDGLFATIMLPREEGPEALDNLVTSLTADSWASWNEHLNRDLQHVRLHLPRFKLEFTKELSRALQTLGLEPAFTGTGEFLQMSSNPGVQISSVVHKATIEVNEEGTVATAATGITMVSRAMHVGERAHLMKVDRPFLFVINKYDGTVLFWGRALTPTLSGIEATSANDA